MVVVLGYYRMPVQFANSTFSQPCRLIRMRKMPYCRSSQLFSSLQIKFIVKWTFGFKPKNDCSLFVFIREGHWGTCAWKSCVPEEKPMIRTTSVHTLNNNALMTVLFLEDNIKGSTKIMCRSVSPKPQTQWRQGASVAIVGVIMSLKMYVEVTSDK